ncbi:MAG: hypothetical protein ACXQS8_03695 [Candidatus Helarchaeales archaeon]
MTTPLSLLIPLFFATWPVLLLFALVIITVKNCVGKNEIIINNKSIAKEILETLNQANSFHLNEENEYNHSQFLILQHEQVNSLLEERHEKIRHIMIAVKRYSWRQYASLCWFLSWMFLTMIMLVPMLLNAYYYALNLIWVIFSAIYSILGYVNFKRGK